MTIRHSDEPRQADPLFERLKQRPFRKNRVPSEERVAAIYQLAASDRPSDRIRSRRRWMVWSGVAVVWLALIAALAYAYETPGGIADWRYSRAAGLSGTVHIPIGSTPEDAVMKFRDITSMKVVHKEAIDGGVLLFIKRFYEKDGTDLQIEYVRKTWLGWKWVMGGGYGISSSAMTREAFQYMSMPKFEGIHGPFPIVFGELSNSSITNVNVTIGGPDAGIYPARIIEFDEGQRLWFSVLPRTAAPAYGIEALNEEGAIVASKSFDDPRDMGSVAMTANTGVQEKPYILTNVTKAIEDQDIKLAPFGITGYPLLLEHVTPQVYGIEAAQNQSVQSDPEFVHIYIFPSREARVKGRQQFDKAMENAHYTTFPHLYEAGNALVIYWAKSKDHPQAIQAMDEAMKHL